MKQSRNTDIGNTEIQTDRKGKFTNKSEFVIL
jgi:hypothetical protein